MEQIARQHEQAIKWRDTVATQEYVIRALKHLDLIENLAEVEQAIETLRRELDEVNTQGTLAEEHHREARARAEDYLKKWSTHELRKEQEDLTQKISKISLDIEEKKRLLQILESKIKREIGNLESLKRAFDPQREPWEDGDDQKLQAAIDSLRSSLFNRQSMDSSFVEQEALGETLREAGQFLASLQVRFLQAKTRLEDKVKEQETIKSRLGEEISGLEQKRRPYRSEVLRLKALLEERLAGRSPVWIFCEEMEILDEAWRNAIEGYLHTQKFDLLVEPHVFSEALRIYEQEKWTSRLEGVGLFFGIFSFSFYKNSNEKVIAHFQKHYYERKTKELTERIYVLTKQLARFQFDSAMKEYSANSLKLFKAKLAERFLNHQERQLFTKESLWKDFGSFIKEYPVILSTTHSLRSCASANYLFDYVIMDEASQVDIVTGALALSCARNAIIVGDLQQLPNVVSGKIGEETNRIFGRFALNSTYHYADNSMLSSMTKLYKNVARTLLKEHYRCHPKIIGFCNQKFYNNELIVLTEENGREKSLVVYKTAKGNHARGNYNQRQIDVIMEEVLPAQLVDDLKQSVGIISPYRMQTDKLKVAVGNRDIEVDTVHKYQGREKDIVILTTVVNEVNEFVDNPNLINVAISRAVDKLIVVVSADETNVNSNIGDLVRYIEYNNFEIINSTIYSVFDLLYHSYSERLLAIMKKRKKVSEYESKNLMNVVIERL